MSEEHSERPTQAAEGSAELGDAKSIDEFVPASWPPHVVAGLEQWKQGDLLRGGARFWAGPGTHDQVTSIPGDGADWDVQDQGYETGWLAVASQTCDISAAGAGRNQPFVEVHPVVRVDIIYPPQKIEVIENWGVTYLAPLSSPPGDGDWAIDMRLTMSISKGLLFSMEPTPGFVSEIDRLNFAEAVATRKRRPALHDVLSSELPKSLGKYISATEKTKPEWWQHVEQVRLKIIGDRLAPNAVSLILCEEIPLDAHLRCIWRGWTKQGKKLLKPHRITLQAPLFMTLDKLPARLYKESVPLRIPELGRVAAW
jgi:hypothetical protein